MSTSRRLLAAVLAAALCALPGCAATKLYDVHEDMANQDGEPIDFQVTRIAAIHFMFDIMPLFGDASLDETMKEFQRAARERGAVGIRIAEVETTMFWWVLPPISFFLPPVTTTVSGDIRYAEVEAPRPE